MYRSLHPLAWWIWAGSLAIGVAMTSSIVLAISVVAAAAIIVFRKSEKTPWAATFPWAFKVGLWVIAIRISVGVLVGVPIPGRTLITIPVLPLPSWMAGIRIGGPVTIERLSATAHEGVMLAAIIILLGAAGSLSSPHRILRSLPIMVYEFGVAVVIATSVLPQLVSSIARIRDAQKLRGQETRGFISWRRIALPMLEDSLSRSLDLAAAMDARGYGYSRKRSRYRPNAWRASEYAICAIAIVALIKPHYLLLPSALTPFILAPTPNYQVSL
jgi:energy-coupling factor transport system permease protein